MRLLKRMFFFCGWLFLAVLPLSAVRITEIFPGGGFFEPEERFVEIYNDSTLSLPLSSLLLSLPGPSGQQTNLSVVRGNFLELPPGVVTQATELAPGQYLVVATEQINAGTRLLPFASGCVLLKPRNQAFTGWSWKDRLKEIACIAGNESFDCASYRLPETIPPGESLHWSNGVFVAGPLSPGYEGGLLSAEKLCLFPRGEVQWRHFGTYSATAYLRTLGGEELLSFSLLPDGQSEVNERFDLPAGLSHGDTVCLECGAGRLLFRVIDPEARSDWSGRVLLNEVVHRSGVDFSGGGWSGSNGGGLCDSSDEWLELVNLSNASAWSTNGPWYAVIRTAEGERMGKLSYRNSSVSNGSGRKYEIPPGGYAVFSIEGGFPDEGVFSLFDGHPYRNGRRVDVYSNSGSDWQGETRVSERFPNGCAEHFSFRKSGRPTFAAHNSGDLGELELLCPPGGDRLQVYLSDSTEKREVFSYHSSCLSDREELFMTNFGYYAAGSLGLSISNSEMDDGWLSVQNGRRLSVFDGGDFLASRVKASLVWTLPGWQIAGRGERLGEAVIYPNPLEAGTEVCFTVGNLSENCELTLISPSGLVRGRWTDVRGGVLKVCVDLEPGVYTVLLRKNGEGVWKKLWVR